MFCTNWSSERSASVRSGKPAPPANPASEISAWAAAMSKPWYCIRSSGTTASGNPGISMPQDGLPASTPTMFSMMAGRSNALANACRTLRSLKGAESKSVAMLGWSRLAATCASRLIASTYYGSADAVWFMTLTATVLRSSVSSARQTLSCPSVPICSRSLYLPIRSNIGYPLTLSSTRGWYGNDQG
jgi:hypothetical protein